MLLIVYCYSHCLWGSCDWFYYEVLNVLSSFAAILMGKRESVALL